MQCLYDAETCSACMQKHPETYACRQAGRLASLCTDTMLADRMDRMIDDHRVVVMTPVEWGVSDAAD